MLDFRNGRDKSTETQKPDALKKKKTSLAVKVTVRTEDGMEIRTRQASCLLQLSECKLRESVKTQILLTEGKFKSSRETPDNFSKNTKASGRSSEPQTRPLGKYSQIFKCISLTSNHRMIIFLRRQQIALATFSYYYSFSRQHIKSKGIRKKMQHPFLHKLPC